MLSDILSVAESKRCISPILGCNKNA